MYFIADAIDELDLSAFYGRYDGDGRRAQPYDPRMLLRVLVYSYARGVFSSRKIARAVEEDVPTRYLAGTNFPSHRTICRFRQQHLDDFENLFVQLLLIAREAGLAVSTHAS
ncbi:MAG: transposase [Planctomycetota bacterium]